MIYKVFLLFITVVTLSLHTANASIIYSGIRDINLEGQANSNQILNINIEGKNNDVSDDLILEILLTGTASIGSNFAGTGIGVVLAASGPSVLNLGLSDPFPVDAVFGSGSFILWDFQNPGAPDSLDIGQFKDTTGYAAMLINTNQDVSHQTYGWVQLAVANSKNLSSPFPRITVIDWAYSDTPGELIAMGQKPSSVPEGGASVVGLIALGGTCWLGGKRFPWKRANCS